MQKTPAIYEKWKVLQGLRNVWVLVESLDSDATRLGITKQRLQTLTELKLRQNGLQILSEQEYRNSSTSTYIYIRLTVLPNVPAFNCEVQLNEIIRLERRSDRTFATTWEAGGMGYGTASDIERALKEHLDRFCNDYLRANPRK